MTLLEFFTRSRYIDFCQEQMKLQREDFRERLDEKNVTIRQLRIELAAAKNLPLPVDIPRPTPISVVKTPGNDAPQDWQGELKKMLEEETNGIRSEGRQAVHEPAPDDGA